MQKDAESQMRVIEVIPIIRGVAKNSLTYFSKEDIPVGTFVKIPIRKGEVTGLVIRTDNPRSIKAELKRASFSLKKLIPTRHTGQLSPEFIRAAEKTALYYATTTGNILASIIPKFLLELPDLVGTIGIESKPKSSNPREPLLIQMEDKERFMEYKSLVRESFARKESVLFLVPTQEDGIEAYEMLRKGIEDYTFFVTRRRPKEAKDVFKKAKREPHPILLIATPTFVSFDRPDLETIILERENSRAYRTVSRPHMHIRVFLEYLAEESDKTVVFGDLVLSLETLWKGKQGEYTELSPLKWRMTETTVSTIVDMKGAKTDSETERREFEIFSDELKALIERSIEEKKKIFLFGARKGLAPSTACDDCGTLLACKNCGAPVVLHHKKPSKEPLYICHACGARRPTDTRCDNCSSWRLTALGIGTEKIAREVERLYPDIPLYILDKDHAGTPAQAERITKKFENETHGVLVGTELAFLHLRQVPYAAIVSLDSLFSIPDFSINERIFYLTSRLLHLARFEAIIQTRNIGREVLTQAKDGNVIDFYRNEMREREELSYPPFSIFITVSSEGAIGALKEKAVRLNELFADFHPEFIEGRGMRTGRITLSMIIRMPRENWPHKTLVEKLLLLPPDFLIKVDPESIL